MKVTEALMTLQLTEEQKRAVRRGEPVRITARGLGKVVLLSAKTYDEEHQSKPARTTKKKTKLTNARLKELAAKHKPPQSWYEEDY
jgi:hypothetical protein